MVTTNQETFTRCISWEDADKKSLGYQDSGLVKKLVESNRQNPPWIRKENDYLNSREIELSCALMRTVGKGEDCRIKVADVGGGNGYMATTARRILPWINWEWYVYESPAIASAYVEFEVGADIKWKCADDFSEEFDVGLMSCSIQYLKNPMEVIKKLSLRSQFLIIMRIPFIDSVDDVVTTQRFIEGIYNDSNASWPAWFFSRQKFDAELENLGTIIYRWKTPTEILLFEGVNVQLEGMLIRTRSFDTLA
jgi:putative methyltransferase (TIGR04325 family)